MIEVSKEELRRFYVNYHGFGEFFELSEADATSAIFGRIRSVQFDPPGAAPVTQSSSCFRVMRI